MVFSVFSFLPRYRVPEFKYKNFPFASIKLFLFLQIPLETKKKLKYNRTQKTVPKPLPCTAQCTNTVTDEEKNRFLQEPVAKKRKAYL
jgi:hypothetical protein